MNDMLTEVRFWAQVVGDAKRTVMCPPDLESRCMGYVAARGIEGLITVKASPMVPADRIFVIDEQAIGAAWARPVNGLLATPRPHPRETP